MSVTLFSQIISNLNRVSFNRIVERYKSDKHSKGINSWTQFVSMLFCHFAKAISLHEISNGLRSATGNLNHLGVTLAPSKSSLSYINQHRDWHLFQGYYFALLEQFSKTATFKRIKFKNIFMLDATVISLVVADRAYIDFKMLYLWQKQNTDFVIRLKKNIKYISKTEFDLPTGKDQHILMDESIIMETPKSYNEYPKRLRRVVVWDDINKKTIELITNQMSWTAATIAELYKQRW